MIRINLLPFRAARKRENVRQQLMVYGLSVAFAVVVMGWLWVDLRGEVSQKEEKQNQLSVELKKYDKVLKQIAELEKQVKAVNEKLAVIKDLEKGKTGPVLLLDEIAMAVPVDKLWLKTLSEGKGNLTMSGTAMDNETVALFMDNLEASEHISSVDLVNVSTQNVPTFKLTVSNFSLKCKTTL